MDNKQLNADELILMEKLNDVLGWEEFEFSVLTQTYITIKFNGIADSGDILQLQCLHVPIYDLIAALREQPITNVMNDRSVSFYEVRKAIDMFVASEWNAK